MEKENKDFFVGLIFGFVVGIIIFTLILAIADPIIVPKETGDDICQQLTGNESAAADHEGGKLICEIPSFDETQNIIIRGNDE